MFFISFVFLEENILACLPLSVNFTSSDQWHQIYQARKKGTEMFNDEERDDFYDLPKILVGHGKMYNGSPIPKLIKHADPVEHVKDLIAMEVRDQDVFILAYPKCGTHWMWEVIKMLLNQTTQYERKGKENTMMEFVPVSHLQSEKSPRVLNSHLCMCHLPTAQIVAKKSKIIHLVRNPKDTTVSLYHHLKQMVNQGFEFWNLVRASMDNAMSNPNQFAYLRQMSQFEKEHPDHPIMHLYYEDMKLNPVKGIKELAEFLDVPASDSFAEEVASACSFDKMKQLDETKEKPAVLIKEMSEKKRGPLKLYRKGVIGDWKNHFTVAQNEIFDEFIRSETEKGLNFKFTYE